MSFQYKVAVLGPIPHPQIFVNFPGDQTDIIGINPDHDDKIDEWTETEEESRHKNVGEFD